MDLKIESDNSAVLTIDGELTVTRAEELRAMLISALENADSITVRFKNIIEADLSCLQLFCSAHRSAIDLNKSLTVSRENSEVFRLAAEAAGFSRKKGCILDFEDTCLWIEGGS
jgi:ABC-type transporter Mla MlaB component